jgi:hypothetical protein
MGVKALKKIQLGRESTAGTAVAATTIWRGMGSIADLRELTFVEEDVGIIGGTDRTYVAKLMSGISLESTPATFEQVLHLLEMAIKTTAPVQDGAGTDYISTYVLPTTATVTKKTYTVEGGDDVQAEEINFVYVESFTLEGAGGEALMMSAELKGQTVATTSFTGALTVPAVDEILVSRASLFLDAAGGTIGSTQISNTLLGVSLSFNSGVIPKFTGDGATTPKFSFLQDTGALEVVLQVTFEHNAAAVTEIANARAETAQLLRLQFDGPTVGTPGTTYNNKHLIIDMAGKWEIFEAISDQDGNNIVTANFRARYNSTAAFFASFVVVHELTAVP